MSEKCSCCKKEISSGFITCSDCEKRISEEQKAFTDFKHAVFGLCRSVGKFANGNEYEGDKITDLIYDFGLEDEYYEWCGKQRQMG